MEKSDADLIRQSHAALVDTGENIAMVFYSHLFDAKPELLQLFSTDPVAQDQRFGSMLQTVVNFAIDPDKFEHTAKDLALRHIGYGVKPLHFEAVGQALEKTLDMGLPQGLQSEARAAWQTAFDGLSKTMITAMALEVIS